MSSACGSSPRGRDRRRQRSSQRDGRAGRGGAARCRGAARERGTGRADAAAERGRSLIPHSAPRRSAQVRFSRLGRDDSQPLRSSLEGNKIAPMGWAEDMNDHATSRTDVLRASPPMFESRMLDALSRVHPVRAGADLRARNRRAGGVGPVRSQRAASMFGAGHWRLCAVDAVRVLAAPDRLPLRARGRARSAHALDHPRRPPRPPERPAAPGDAAGRERAAGGARVRGCSICSSESDYAPGARRGLLRRLPRLRHDPLLPAPLPPARPPRADAARAPHAPPLPGRHARASGSAPLTGTRSSAPPARAKRSPQ